MIKKVCRGDIFYASLDPVIGSEQGGNRPVIIVRGNNNNSNNSVITIAPVTTELKKAFLGTHFVIDEDCNLPEKSMLLGEQIRSIDVERLGEYVGSVSYNTMIRIEEHLKYGIGINPDNDPYQFETEVCASCANRFYNGNRYIILRKDKFDKAKGICFCCGKHKAHKYIFIRKNRMRRYLNDIQAIKDTQKRRHKGVNLCLCPSCSSHYYSDENYIVKKIDKYQQIKNTCMLCQVKTGFDYHIIRKNTA